MLGSKKKEQFSVQVLQIIDALIILGSFYAAYLFRGLLQGDIKKGFDIGAVAWMLYIIVPFFPLLLEAFRFYNNPMRKKVSSALTQMTRTLIFVGALLGGVMFALRLPQGSRLILVIGMGLSVICIFIRFLLVKKLLRSRIKDGADRERVLIAGTIQDIESLLAGLPDNVTDYWEVRDKIDLHATSASELEEKLKEHSIQRVIFAAQHAIFKELSDAVEVCEEQGVEVWVSASFIRTQVSRPAFDTLGANPMLVFKTTPDLSWSLLLKAAMDRVGATVLIILTLPLWIFAYIGIKVASPGPVFFKQDRAGKYGRSFKMWKFRTMVMDAEAKLAEVKKQQGNEMDGPVFKLENDPRVFKFARLLRKLSIDELPQLINVVKGDMSLVGPRPLPCYEVVEFEKSKYRRRLSVKPGITCTWQAGGRNTITSFEDWVRLDLEYIDNWSLWLDIKILFKTVPAVLFSKGAK